MADAEDIVEFISLAWPENISVFLRLAGRGGWGEGSSVLPFLCLAMGCHIKCYLYFLFKIRPCSQQSDVKNCPPPEIVSQL